jgi:ion channel-forming bestrophin family protein
MNMSFVSKRSAVGIALALTYCLSKSSAFVPQPRGVSPLAKSSPTTGTTTTTTTLNDVAYVPKDDGSGTSYSERSRPYRRDVFAYDDWVRHRSSDRFAGRLAKLTKSGIARALQDEVLLLVFVAGFICVFNALLATGYDDFSGVHHDPLVGNIGVPILSLPSMFFTLSSPALSLLLGR